uniref:14 kDa phosphohistidine phosphatase n=1 Tax=Fundulus heteroclitus TaxID=8078 RepID=A0A3Q2QTG3_FUNHE
MEVKKRKTYRTFGLCACISFASLLLPPCSKSVFTAVNSHSSAESPSLVSGDIYDKVSAELEGGGLLDCECIGGGRIKHEPDVKKIHVYGYSIGYGRANHAVTTEKLKDQYPDYQVTWDNEGY